MSLALESLMRVYPDRPDGRVAGGGIVPFVLIGGSGALGFILSSSALIAALPMVEAWVISVLCYAAFIVPIYLLHRRFTFGATAAHGQALPRYVAVQMLALALAAVFSFLFHGTLGLPSLPAAILVNLLTAGVNYMVLKSWAFAASRRLAAAAA
ncbi:GtrA family protein [Devosia sp. XK-2]|uniref:GtrA family protein n=1 Tax=Devosia sp. XK-2 TaxID=3126689 RepID=UPI0030D3E00F